MCYRERTLKLLPLVYVIVGVVCMGVALSYFQMNVYDSNVGTATLSCYDHQIFRVI